jgi:uncharacterized membrane protein
MDNEQCFAPQPPVQDSMPPPSPDALPLISEQEKAQKASLATASQVLGIVALSLFVCSINIFFLPGILCSSICAIIAICFARRSRIQKRRSGKALCGLVCGIIALSMCVMTVLFFVTIVVLLIVTAPLPEEIETASLILHSFHL